MPLDLRVGFGKRHRKRLYEAIDIIPPSAEKACPEGVREKFGRKIPSMLAPPLDAPGSSSVLVVEEEAGLVPRGVSGRAIPVEGISDPNENSTPAFPLSWYEMMETLKPVPCFIDAEPPFTKIFETAKVVFSRTLTLFLN